MKKIIVLGVIIGLYIGLFFTFFIQFGEMKGTSMSVDDTYKTCYGFLLRTQDISGKGTEKVCFRVEWSSEQVCHRCEKITYKVFDYNYVCYGDNKKSTVDYIRKQDIYGVVLTEVCI